MRTIMALIMITILLPLAGLAGWVTSEFSAITIGERSFYFDGDPTLDQALHEAVHQRQWREGGAAFGLRYLTRAETRVLAEAEAAAAEYCLEMPADGTSVTWALLVESREIARAYLAPTAGTLAAANPVAHFYDQGRGCSALLRGVDIGKLGPLARARPEYGERLSLLYMKHRGSGPADLARARDIRRRWQERPRGRTVRRRDRLPRPLRKPEV